MDSYSRKSILKAKSFKCSNKEPDISSFMSLSRPIHYQYLNRLNSTYIAISHVITTFRRNLQENNEKRFITVLREQ